MDARVQNSSKFVMFVMFPLCPFNALRIVVIFCFRKRNLSMNSFLTVCHQFNGLRFEFCVMKKKTRILCNELCQTGDWFSYFMLYGMQSLNLWRIIWTKPLTVILSQKIWFICTLWKLCAHSQFTRNTIQFKFIIVCISMVH